ncbi:MAG: hypothetical protein WC525_03590 [Candidatus Thermoplasmatota archaeon]
MKKQLKFLGFVFILVSIYFTGCTETEKQNELTTINPLIITFSSNPYSIDYGDISELSWQVSNATSVSIDNDIGFVSLIGERIVAPTKSTTYILTARNGNNTMTASAQVIVKQIDYETLLVGTWNLILGFNISDGYLIFNADRTARFGTTHQHSSSYSDYFPWWVRDNVLYTQQGDYPASTWNLSYNDSVLTIYRTDGDAPPYEWGGKYVKEI